MSQRDIDERRRETETKIREDLYSYNDENDASSWQLRLKRRVPLIGVSRDGVQSSSSLLNCGIVSFQRDDEECTFFGLDPREPEDEDDERYDESDVRFRLIVGLTIKTISSTKFAVLDRIAAQGFHWNSQGRHFVLHGRRGGPDKIVYNNQLTLELEMLRMADYYGRAAVATGGTILIASHNMSKFMRIDDNGDGTFKMKKTVHYDGDRTDSVVISGEWLYKTMRNLAFALAPILEDEDCETAVEDEDYYDYDSESSDSSDSEW